MLDIAVVFPSWLYCILDPGSMAMVPPTTAQQKGLAYAPIPFAVISFLSSSYVIYHLLFQERKKLERLYHRLVLAMNIAQLPVSFTYIWGTMKVPKGTPYYAGAMGTANTCTAGAFIYLVFSMAVATYYASLVLQSFMGIRNNFKEDKYRWIEIPVHLFAYCIPCVCAIALAATENFNPNGAGCWVSKAPRGCESDPDIECERGDDIKYVTYVLGVSQICLYFVYPPLVILAMHCWMKKAQIQGATNGSGMTIIREKARKEMMWSVYRQISLYLFSFWSTWVLQLIATIYRVFTGDLAYNLFIFSNCIFALQGFVFMAVYFALQKMGRGRKVDFLPNETLSSDRPGTVLTVAEIRLNAQQKAEDGCVENASNEEGSFNFNIFDGEPDPDSPWARFFKQSTRLSGQSLGDIFRSRRTNKDEPLPDNGAQPPLNEEIELRRGDSRVREAPT